MNEDKSEIKNEKSLCPDKNKCRSKDVNHFRAMSHPHLESILLGRLNQIVTFQDVLPYDPSVRFLLYDQLTILQKILRENKNLPVLKKSPIFAIKIEQNDGKTSNKLVAIPGTSKTCLSNLDAILKESREFIKLNDPPLEQASYLLYSNGLIKIQGINPSISLSTFKNFDKNFIEPGPSSSSSSSSSSSYSVKRSAPSPPINNQKKLKTIQPSENLILNAYDELKTHQLRKVFRYKAIKSFENSSEIIKKIPHLEQPGEFLKKYNKSSPYFLFFNCIQDLPATWNKNNSITFPEILDPSLGEIKKTLYINDEVDLTWLRMQYLFAYQKTDCLIIYGIRKDTGSVPKNIDMYYCKQHSKIMIINYENGARIVILTANLYSDDWNVRTQVLWMSPHLDYLDPSKSGIDFGESVTGFKRDFTSYLKTYNIEKLKEWLELIERLDFSNINVFFVGSVPGDDNYSNKWGIDRLGYLLSQYANFQDKKNWPVVVQCSSLGGFGSKTSGWLNTEIIPRLFNKSNDSYSWGGTRDFKIIYPTANNYRRSLDMEVGSFCLHYHENLHGRQKWIKGHLCQWKTDQGVRDLSMPHSKFYMRISEDWRRVAWAVVTSANLSKSAWGYENKFAVQSRKYDRYGYKRSGRYGRYHDNDDDDDDSEEDSDEDDDYYEEKIVRTINNFEAGVAFFPMFLTGENSFPIQATDENGIPPFPLPFDVPLTPYDKKTDEPFLL